MPYQRLEPSYLAIFQLELSYILKILQLESSYLPKILLSHLWIYCSQMLICFEKAQYYLPHLCMKNLGILNTSRTGLRRIHLKKTYRCGCNGRNYAFVLDKTVKQLDNQLQNLLKNIEIISFVQFSAFTADIEDNSSSIQSLATICFIAQNPTNPADIQASSSTASHLVDRPLIQRAHIKLIILDVNGLLLVFVDRFEPRYQPCMRLKKKFVKTCTI